MKPVQTGGLCREDGLLASPDLDWCLQVADMTVGPEEYGVMAPYVFEPACSPHLAAALSSREISFERIWNAFKTLLERHECVVVEGAGGLMVPVAGDKMMLDLMVLLGLPVILAARPGLGTLNHTLLSLRELERSSLDVFGVLFCETRPKATWGEIEEDNRRVIEQMGKASVLGCIPYMEGIQAGEIPIDTFHSEAVRPLRLPWISNTE